MFYILVPSAPQPNASNSNVATTTTTVIQPVQVPAGFTMCPVQVPTVETSPVPVFTSIAPNVPRPQTSGLNDPTTSDSKKVVQTMKRKLVPSNLTPNTTTKAPRLTQATKTTINKMAASKKTHPKPTSDSTAVKNKMYRLAPINTINKSSVLLSGAVVPSEVPTLKPIASKSAKEMQILKKVVAKTANGVPVCKQVAPLQKKPTVGKPIFKEVMTENGVPMFKQVKIKTAAEVPPVKQLPSKTVPKLPIYKTLSWETVAHTPKFKTLKSKCSANRPVLKAKATERAEAPVLKPIAPKIAGKVPPTKPATSNSMALTSSKPDSSSTTLKFVLTEPSTSASNTESSIYSVLDEIRHVPEKRDVCRKQFEEELRSCYKNRPPSLKPQWTKERIMRVIKIIEDYNNAPILKLPRCNEQYHYSSKYDIWEEGGKQYLIQKRKAVNDPVIKIVPSEEYYEIVTDIHLKTGHGGRDRMLQALKSKYYFVPAFVVNIVIKCCKICQNRKTNFAVKKAPVTRDIQDYRGTVALIDMRETPDGNYKWILHYQDYITKFSWLRPLVSNDTDEIALELLKIFLEIGFPPILETSLDREFTAALIKKLEISWSDCKIINGKPKNDDIKYVNTLIRKKLEVWMSENGTNNWPIGIYFVQYKLNSSASFFTEHIPFKALFGKGLKGSTKYSLPVNTKQLGVYTEEELEKLIDDLMDVQYDLKGKDEAARVDCAQDNTIEEDCTQENDLVEENTQVEGTEEDSTQEDGTEVDFSCIKSSCEDDTKEGDTQEKYKYVTEIPITELTTNKIKEEPLDKYENTDSLLQSLNEPEETYEITNSNEQGIYMINADQIRNIIETTNIKIENIKEEFTEITFEDEGVQAKRLKETFYINIDTCADLQNESTKDKK